MGYLQSLDQMQQAPDEADFRLERLTYKDSMELHTAVMIGAAKKLGAYVCVC